MKTKRSNFTPRITIASVALTLAISQALTPNAFAAASTATVSGGLEEIIVTAQKRVQNPQEVGIAISAVTGADLASLGAFSASDITKTMPAVVLTQPLDSWRHAE